MPMTISELFSNLQDDIRILAAARRGQLQLKVVEKGVPAAVKSVYFAFIAALILLLLPILFVTGALAFGLIFASTGDVYHTIRSLTLGFCCMDVAQIIIIVLLFMLQKPITRSIESSIINNMLDDIEKKEQEATQSNAQHHSTDAQEAEEAEVTEVIRVTKVEPTSHN